MLISSYIFLILGLTALFFAVACWVRMGFDVAKHKFDWRTIFDPGAYRVRETMIPLYNIYLGICLTLAGVGIIWLSFLMRT